MTRTIRRGHLALLTLLSTVLVAAASFTAPAATAAPIPLHWDVNASTHIKSLNMDVVVPTGSFDGTVDLATGDLVGNLTLPPASKSISLFGLPIASTTFAMSQAEPITGHVDLATMTVTVDASFNFAIKKAALSFLPWLNLVGNSCRGTSPINVSMTGPISLTGASSFTASYTLPKLTGCGFLTPILNLIIPGPGNTFTTTFAPAT